MKISRTGPALVFRVDERVGRWKGRGVPTLSRTGAHGGDIHESDRGMRFG